MTATRGMCLPFVGGYEYVKVTLENKAEVLDFLKPWEIVDITFEQHPTAGQIYNLIHADPDYNAEANDGAPWMWGRVGDYLTKDTSAHADQDFPLEVTPEAFTRFHLVADTGIQIQITSADLKARQEAFDEWYDKEYGDA